VYLVEVSGSICTCVFVCVGCNEMIKDLQARYLISPCSCMLFMGCCVLGKHVLSHTHAPPTKLALDLRGGPHRLMAFVTYLS